MNKGKLKVIKTNMHILEITGNKLDIFNYVNKKPIRQNIYLHLKKHVEHNKFNTVWKRTVEQNNKLNVGD